MPFGELEAGVLELGFGGTGGKMVVAELMSEAERRDHVVVLKHTYWKNDEWKTHARKQPTDCI